MIVLVGLCLAAVAQAGELLVDFLDVGQGDSILIRGGGKYVLIDAGTRRANVADQLAALGVDHLDLAITTHPHADHMGGMESVIRAMPVGLYIDNGMTHTTQSYDKLMTAVEELAIPYRTGRRGLQLNLGSEATLTVLHPGDTLLSDTRSDLNSNSVVVLLDHDDIEMLFTGDAEEPTEALLARMDIPHLDVLKVAHHGSEHSSSMAFLQAVQPTYAVISCGADNRYGHPAPEALERLHAVGSLVFRTDLSGHIRAISDGETVELLELGDVTGLAPQPRGRRPVAMDGPGRGPAVALRPPAPPAPPPSHAAAPPPPDARATPTPSMNLSGVRTTEPVTPLMETRRERRRRLKAERRAARAAGAPHTDPQEAE